MYRTWYGKNNRYMPGKETLKIGADYDKMEKLIKCHMHVHYHIKRFFEKEKTSSRNGKAIHCFFFEW